MLAGEAGADYVMFGEPDDAGRRPNFEAVVERVAWWAEVFQPPCVGFAGSAAEVAPLAQAGADFVALGDWIWSAQPDPAAAVRAAGSELSVVEPVV
jgi:thiamine-phosphate pyrophosphorylase